MREIKNQALEVNKQQTTDVLDGPMPASRSTLLDQMLRN